MRILQTVYKLIFTRNAYRTYLPYIVISDVTVGLQSLNQEVVENQNFSICAQITQGHLERDVRVGMEAKNGSAIRKEMINVSNYNIMY